MFDTIAKALDIDPLNNESLKEIYDLLDKSNGSSSNRDGYGNRQDGVYNSFYGKRHTEESKKIMSEKALSRDNSHLKGRKFSNEHRKKISESRKGKSSARKGVDPWNKGMPMSEESKKKLSESNRGKKRNQEARTRIKEGMLKAKEKNMKTCEYCGKKCSPGNYSRWHGKNCKKNGI